METELRKLTAVVRTIRVDVNTDVALPQLHLFLEICLQEGITQHELIDKTGVQAGTISRHLKMLSTYMEEDRKGTRVLKGYKLIEQRPDLYERRRMACSLTPKGKALRDKIAIVLACTEEK